MPLSEFTKTKSNYVKLFGLSVLGILQYFQFYVFVILSEKLKSFSIQQRNYVILCAKIGGRFSLFFILICATRRFLNFFISSVILAFSFCILIASFLLEQVDLEHVAMVVTGKDYRITLVFICMAGSIIPGHIYNYATELFPSHFRGFVLGFFTLVGTFTASLIPYIGLLADYLNLHFLSVFFPLSLTLFLVSFCLPETIHKILDN